MIDCLGVLVGEQRGAERFICGLVAELAQTVPGECLVWVNRASHRQFERVVGRQHCVVAPVSGRNRTLRMMFQMLFGPFLVLRVRPRIYVSSSLFPMLGFRCPTAVFLYDLIPLHFPETYGWLDRTVRRWLLSASLPRASAVFTISQASADDITSHFGGRIGPVYVIPCGTEPFAPELASEAADKVLLSELRLDSRPFVLSVLGGKLYKNQAGLAQATDLLRRRGRLEIDVVVVGDAVHVFRRMPHPPNLRAFGVVNDRILAALYRKARAFVYPTFMEGFGLPVIEAQAAGLPVVCSDIPVLREVSGGAAIFVDPHSPESIAEGVLQAIEDTPYREQLIARGGVNAARYSWYRTVEYFLNACDLVASGRRAPSCDHLGVGEQPLSKQPRPDAGTRP